MRYYGFELNTSVEKLEKNATIKWKDYDYDSPISAMNKYLYQKIKNGITFLAYGVSDNNTVYSIFSYDESKYTYKDAYNCILDMLEATFRMNKVKTPPYEITSQQYYEYILEAKRRGYYNHYRLIELANLRIHDDSYKMDERSIHFFISEKIISGTVSTNNTMYDKSLINELANIAKHKCPEEMKGNMVHYVISAKSAEAASDITEALMNSLYAVNRISTKRMVYISEIDPELYKGTAYLEEVIENNTGGAVVIDLSEKFGKKPTYYGMAIKYIQKLVKKYRNDCLFVFTYNMDSPGFSYGIIPELRKYVIPVTVKEGEGNRKDAVNYMKKLIRKSEYSKYANQAGKFMERFPGDEFSQTDVLMAFEQFGAWCINENILKAYNFDSSDDFKLEYGKDKKSAYDTLHSLIGLANVKEQIDGIIAANYVEKERKKYSSKAYKTGTMHMIFSGNPGSAKTTVAKLFAGIGKEKGIFRSGAFVEASGTEFLGLDCVYRIREAFAAAKGGVLFIDEAYAIQSDIAVTALIQEMENRRDEVIVILAGYNERMQEFMNINEGLKSRIPYWVDFPDYDTEELTEIFKMMLEDSGFKATEDAVHTAQYILDKARYVDDFGNGRYVRNLLEAAIKNQSIRLLGAKESAYGIPKKELFLITADDVKSAEKNVEVEREAGTALKELDAMIGLSSAKAVIKKAIASYKLNKFCLEKGIHKDKASMHMIFTGNPGTAKTTVARLLAEILKDEKVLPSGKFVELGRADLVGTHVGHTAPKVKKRFREAQGGVLFIDEAYSLCDSCEGSFGDEAINTIVQEMENHREDVIVIFAGYPDEMQKFLDRNPGLSSRIAFKISFEDYSTEELCKITELMLSKKNMTATDAATNKLKKIYEDARQSNDYGNGRFVRKMLEEAEMNLAERIYALKESELTVEILTTLEECDIPDWNGKSQESKRTIGFRIV